MTSIRSFGLHSRGTRSFVFVVVSFLFIFYQPCLESVHFRTTAANNSKGFKASNEKTVDAAYKTCYLRCQSQSV